jgi:hypothetical protein
MLSMKRSTISEQTVDVNTKLGEVMAWVLPGEQVGHLQNCEEFGGKCAEPDPS